MTLSYYPAFLSLLLVRYLISNYSIKYKGKTISEYNGVFNVIFYPLLWIPLISGYFLIRGIGNYNWWVAMIIWSASMIIISYIGKTVNYILLGYASAIFMSELYEIPIYALRYVNGTFLTNSSLITIIPKLLFIFAVLYMMKEIGINYKKYSIILYGFSFFYILLSGIVYALICSTPILNYLVVILMRVIVIGFTTLFIYDETNYLRSVRNG